MRIANDKPVRVVQPALQPQTPVISGAPRRPAIADAARIPWPGAHNRGLARFTGVALGTARSWNRGRRRPPVSVLTAVQNRIADVASEAGTIALWMRSEVAAREREPPTSRGFMRHRAAAPVRVGSRWGGAFVRPCRQRGL